MEKILCFDIGGMSLKYAIYDKKLTCHYTGSKKYRLLKIDKILSLINEIYAKLKTEIKITAVCISSSGIINAKTKEIYLLPSVQEGLRKIKVKHCLPDIDVEVFIENDANCAMLAELNYGNAKNSSNVICFTVGTALGSSIAIRGKLYKGSNLLAGEIGCGIFSFEKEQFQNISQNCGMNALLLQYCQQTKENINEINGKYVVDMAISEKNKIAVDCFNKLIDNLSKTILNTAFLIDPQLILIGGAISVNNEFIKRLINRLDYYHLHSGVKRMYQIKACRFYNDANLIGAMSLTL